MRHGKGAGKRRAPEAVGEAEGPSKSSPSLAVRGPDPDSGLSTGTRPASPRNSRGRRVVISPAEAPQAAGLQGLGGQRPVPGHTTSSLSPALSWPLGGSPVGAQHPRGPGRLDEAGTGPTRCGAHLTRM